LKKLSQTTEKSYNFNRVLKWFKINKSL